VNNVEKKNGYVYGSAAPNLPVKEERSFETERVHKKAAVKPLPPHSAIPKAKMVFCVIFVVAVSFILLYRYSAIAELNFQMENLNDEYSQLTDENRKLEVQIATSINLDHVKEIAETKLKMHKPDNYQVVLVSVPKNNYSIIVDQKYIDQTTRNASLMDKLLNAVKAVLP
jgi:cell division protein FtsL